MDVDTKVEPVEKKSSLFIENFSPHLKDILFDEGQILGAVPLGRYIQSILMGMTREGRLMFYGEGQRYLVARLAAGMKRAEAMNRAAKSKSSQTDDVGLPDELANA